MPTLPSPAPQPRPTLLLSFAFSTLLGLGFLVGYHLRTMERIPESWMLCTGLIASFCALLYRLNYLEQRVARLEHNALNQAVESPKRRENLGHAPPRALGTVLKLSDREAIESLPPRQKFIAMVTLVAVQNGADRIRFAREAGVWSISVGSGEDWLELKPICDTFPVPQIVHWLSRHRGWASFLPPWSFATGTRGFALDLGGGAIVRCVPSENENGDVILIRLFPNGPSTDRSSELM